MGPFLLRHSVVLASSMFALVSNSTEVFCIVLRSSFYCPTGHIIHCVPENVTTFSMISWTRLLCLPIFLHYYWDYRLSTDVYIFPPHLFSAAALPWETVTTKYQ